MSKSAELKRIAASVETLAQSSPRNTAMPAREKNGQEKMPLAGRFVLWLGGSDKKVSRGIGLRRSFPITAYVGPNGGGKTLCMVLDTLPTLRGKRWECANPAHKHTAQGVTSGRRRVLSTVRMLDLAAEVMEDLGRWDLKPAHPLYEEFNDFDQLVEAEHADVLADEIVGMASSRESQKMDPRVANKLVQLRRSDVTMRWTAPNWARADRILREVTQAVVECRGYFARRSGDLWAAKRVFRFRTFDTLEFDEWTAGKRERAEPMNGHWFKGVGSTAFRAYDTLDAVSVVSSRNDDEVCDQCGLHKRREYCRGHHGPTPAAGELLELHRR